MKTELKHDVKTAQQFRCKRQRSSHKSAHTHARTFTASPHNFCPVVCRRDGRREVKTEVSERGGGGAREEATGDSSIGWVQQVESLAWEGLMKARRKGVCVCVVRVLGKGKAWKRARVGRETGWPRGEKGSARHAQVLRSDDLEKGRGQHPGTQA